LASDLDGEFNNSVERSHEHTGAIEKAFDGNVKLMREGYGVIGDVAVSYYTLYYYHEAIYTNSQYYKPFTASFPRSNIHELMAPDLLHQIIKGVFKDHIVTWVVEWMGLQPNGKRIIAEMDRRYAVNLFYSISYL
jgi:hypothetical protein